MHEGQYQIIHLDLKGANILEHGIIDFGTSVELLNRNNFSSHKEYLDYVRDVYKSLRIQIKTAGTEGYIDPLMYLNNPKTDDPVERQYEIDDAKIGRPENDIASFAITELNAFFKIHKIPNLPFFTIPKESNPDSRGLDENYYQYYFHNLKTLVKEDGSQLLPEEFFRSFYIGVDRSDHPENKFRGEQISQVRPTAIELHTAMRESLSSLMLLDINNLRREMKGFNHKGTDSRQFMIYEHIKFGKDLDKKRNITEEEIEEVKKRFGEKMDKNDPFNFQ